MATKTVSKASVRHTEDVDLKHFYSDRLRVYPKAVHGPARQVKYAVLIACLSLYYLLPWLRWDRGPGHPNQMVLLDLPNRRFYFASLELWPQDIYFLAGALIMAAVFLFLITSVAGRVWCGYTCPQTVWTDLFMWVERRIEGDRNERIRRDHGPTNFDRIWRKIAKHAAWLFVAFWTGGAWIMYYVDAPTAVKEFWTGTASAPIYVFTFLFTGFTYLLGGWAREQVCTYMCPWPRFQSAMMDEQSLTVTYQKWRGEPRGHGRRDAAHQQPGQPKLGDCIDCKACVHACPTGIDIRDGIQLECINCGLCVDACNEIMVKTGQPKWLITWDTLARQTAKAEGKFEKLHLLRPRTIIYVAVMVLALVAMAVALVMRPRQELFVQHDRAPLFVVAPSGQIRNTYTVAISNKTMQDTTYDLEIQGIPDATIRTAQESENTAARQSIPVTVPADSVGSVRVFVTGTPTHLKDGSHPLEFVLMNKTNGTHTEFDSVFMGPQ